MNAYARVRQGGLEKLAQKIGDVVLGKDNETPELSDEDQVDEDAAAGAD